MLGSSLARTWLVALLIGASSFASWLAGVAQATEQPPDYREALPPTDLPAAAPARRLANLSTAACRVALSRSGLPVERDRRSRPGVGAPARIVGQLHGVRFILPPKSSKYGVVDCRLVLALGELAKVVAEYDVAAVRIDNSYRPRAHLPGSRRPSQHNYALAADIMGFVLTDGRTLDIKQDWPAAIGAAVCGPDATLGRDLAEARELRNIVCAIARARLFHHILTPNYNSAHRDHVHVDLQRNNRRGTIH